MVPSDVGLLSSAPMGVHVHCCDVCMMLSDDVGDAELSKPLVNLKMAVQVRR